MDISIDTPALLFSTISLLLLVYTNRFLSVAALVRELIKQQGTDNNKFHTSDQIKHLKMRLRLIKNMQVWGVVSFLFSVAAMYLVYTSQMDFAHFAFALAMLSFLISLILLLVEVYCSNNALEIALTDYDKKNN